MIVFIVGPSAVGKSKVAIELAKSLKGEIVSCDAMQVYKEVVIVSDRPSEAMLRAVPHHLIGVVSVEEDFSVARYRELAVQAIEDILRRGRVPIVCGGSGMYMMALLDGIFEGGAADPAVRKKLVAVAEAEGAQALHDRLKDIDPVSAGRINPHDLKRIIRALEIFETKSKPLSELQKKRDGLWSRYDVRAFCLNRPRPELYCRAEARVEDMFRKGMVDEVASLLKKKLSRTAGRMIGIPEVQGYLLGGYGLDRAKYLLNMNTRHYVKRQLTWFRKDKRLVWLDTGEDADTKDVVKTIMDELDRHKAP